jgi:hypothetical protein
MDGGVDGIVLYGGYYVEPGLFKAQTKAAYAGEKINSDGSIHVLGIVRQRNEDSTL